MARARARARVGLSSYLRLQPKGYEHHEPVDDVERREEIKVAKGKHSDAELHRENGEEDHVEVLEGVRPRLAVRLRVHVRVVRQHEIGEDQEHVDDDDSHREELDLEVLQEGAQPRSEQSHRPRRLPVVWAARVDPPCLLPLIRRRLRIAHGSTWKG
eukprot:scaffold23860_cov44-Phaeocystis_antarctica.AAC.1